MRDKLAVSARSSQLALQCFRGLQRLRLRPGALSHAVVDESGAHIFADPESGADSQG